MVNVGAILIFPTMFNHLSEPASLSIKGWLLLQLASVFTEQVTGRQ